MKKILLLVYLLSCTVYSNAQYTASSPISLSAKSNMVISGKSFTSGTNGISIFLSGCSNIRITNCSFQLNSGIIAIQLQNCSNIEIDGNNIQNFRTGVYAINCTGGINIHCNSFKDIAGAKPRGQIVQFNTCKGTGNRVNYNVLDHTFGTGYPEDLINMYGSSGTAADPLQIIGNNLRGGGPSTSGGGIMVGDNGGHDILVADNILVDPGQYGIGVPAGYNITVKNNKVFGKQQAWTNVGLYVGLAGEIAAGFPCTGNTIRIEGNQINWTRKDGIKNGWYNCSCCPGVTVLNNNFNAPITASILPTTLTINSTACGTVVANKAPAVSITSPLSTNSFTAPASITLTASASDSDGSISKVDFYNGTTLLYSDATSPYSYTWPSVLAGSYTLTAKATDNSGATTNSTSISIVVKTATVPNQAPTISLTSPLNNSNYTAPASVTLSATASDADGTIAKVDFYNGASLLKSVTAAPFSYTWTNVAAGSYTIIAKATDNSGATTNSSSISIVVKSATIVNQAPTISLTNPLNTSNFTAPASVTLSATASDADGSITKVDFYNGTTLLSSDVSSSYSYSWNNVAAGNYTLKAIAYDNKGASSTSSIVISVSTPTTTTVTGLNGLSCITAGQSYTYSVAPESSHYTTISFWSNTGAVITQDAADKRKMTITVPSYLNGTSFTLYSGVNYSVSPWYKEYTKTIKVGGCSARIESILSPQPTETSATLELENKAKILSIQVFDSQGKEVFRAEKLDAESYELGSTLSVGFYSVVIQSMDGTTTTKFIKK